LIFTVLLLGNVMWFLIVNALAYISPHNFNEIEESLKPWGSITWREIEDKYWDHSSYDYPIFDGKDFFTILSED